MAATDWNIFIRLSGITAILAAVLNIFLSFQDQPPENSLPWYYRVADIAVFITLIGIYLYQKQETGIFGLISILIIMAALVMLILNMYYSIAISVYTLGLILLAITILNARIFPAWIPWMWIIAPFIALAGYIPSIPANLQTILVRLGTITFGLGFVGIGYHLFTGGKA